MNRILLLIALVSTTSLFAQDGDMVSMGSGYTNQSFYSMANGEVSNVSNTNWDIAFLADAFGTSVFVNDNTGTLIYLYGNDVNEWDNVDVNSVTLEALYAPRSSWGVGVFPQVANEQNPFDYGWGEYNVVSHQLEGSRIFIVQLSTGDYKKLLIESQALGSYTFKYADADGGNEQQVTVNGADYSSKNFWYYSMQTNEVIDREPASDTWDITFTRYFAEVIPGSFYPVSGVLHNNGVFVAEANEVAVDQAVWTDHEFMEEIDVIGSDWKSFDGMAYSITENQSFFVQDLEGNVWHLWFTSFAGGGTGNIEFNKELVSATGLNEQGKVDFTLYPNPAQDHLNVVVAVEREAVQWTLLDTKGSVVNTGQWNQGMQHRIELNEIPAGLYILQIQREGGFGQQKVFVD